MADQIRTKCGIGGLNSDSIRNDSIISPLKISVYGQWISSTSGLGRYFVRRNDRISFSELHARKIIPSVPFSAEKVFREVNFFGNFYQKKSSLRGKVERRYVK
jgi:hypothetical protein